MDKEKKIISFLKRLIKHIFYELRLAKWLDRLVFFLQKIKYRKANHLYRSKHPYCILPPDYDLYETYRLHYQSFIEDGKLAAAEIKEWAGPYVNTAKPCILDWGCGSGRIIRHMPSLFPEAMVTGCDSNTRRIAWNKAHYPGIDFYVTDYAPSTQFREHQFDLIYGISIFTHIESVLHPDWIQELHRILKPGGILLVTTQGSDFINRLLPGQQKILLQNGIFTRNYTDKGHRLLSTYQLPENVKKTIASFFSVKEWYEGKSNPHKAGGQDLWILQKNKE